MSTSQHTDNFHPFYMCLLLHTLYFNYQEKKLIILLELKEFEPSLVFMMISLREFKEHFNVDIVKEC